MGSKASRSYTDAHHIWGWSERLTQWYDSDPEPGADADLIFQPCREAEKALGNCEQHQAQIVQRHLASCENTSEAFLNDRRSDQWAEFLRAADLLRDKLIWLSETLESSVRTTLTDATLVSADQLGAFAGVGGKVIRVALKNSNCKPFIESKGKGNPHQWRYCDAVQALRTVKSGKLRSFMWPDSAAEVSPP